MENIHPEYEQKETGITISVWNKIDVKTKKLLKDRVS